MQQKNLFEDGSLSRPAAAALAATALVAPALVSLYDNPSRSPSTKVWYALLRKPRFNPPKAVFPIVWTALDGALAVGAYRLARQPSTPQRNRALGLFAVNVAMIAAIAPPAPSGRYSFAPNESPVLMLRRKAPWAMIASVAVGLVVGAIAVFALLYKRPARTVVVTTQSTASSGNAAPDPTVRKVVVPLPFLATHVTFDDVSRDLDPAGDVTAFELPRESGVRHRVTATAIDGSRAAGFVREEDGVARVEAEGFAFELPSPATSSTVSRGTGRTAPVGTVKNGFTKLR